MKKRISMMLILVILLTVLLTACGETKEPDNKKTENQIETQTEVPEKTETDTETESSETSWSTMEELLSIMTLDEKIGQMTQAERLDLEEGDVTNYYLGSILSGGGSAPESNTPSGWSNMVNGLMDQSLQTRLAIPIIYGIDAVHGHNNVKNATMFPHNIGLGAIAAGDLEKGLEAAKNTGQVTAAEMITTGIRWDFAPVLGVPEDIRWGRTYEGYSENLDIVTAMGTSFIHGLQGDPEHPAVAACMKHFLGEGQTEDGINQGEAFMTEEEIRRILPPYIEAIEAGALTLMPSFSSVNGIKMHQHKELLTDLLKDEMGFQGFIISDWAAVTQLTGTTYKEQIANAINAGVDMVMATGGRNSWVDFIKNLKELVEEGTVPMERIDDAVTRILYVKEKIGLFETPKMEASGQVGTAEHRALAKNAVADSLVLLKNEDNIVSKLKDFNRILVTGQGGNDIGMQCGGWTISWQGAHGTSTQGTVIAKGIKEAASGEVVYSQQGDGDGDFDAVIAVIGESPYAETDGDRSDHINLRQMDIDMLEKVYKMDCPVIVIMLSGRPMTIGEEADHWDAFIAAWLPGTEGDGIAEVLFGERDFVGKTPYTWHKSIGGEVLYPYGYGLKK